MTDNSKAVKKTTSSTSDDKAISQQYKWEQKNFVEALENGQFLLADKIIETTVVTAEAKRKWWDREDAKPHLLKYLTWMDEAEQQAGRTDHKYWRGRIERFRESIGLENYGVDKKDGAVNVQVNFINGVPRPERNKDD